MMQFGDIVRPNNAVHVMEYAEGEALDKARDKLSFQQRLAVFRKIVDIVRQMHERNVYHLDLKPDNIVVDRDLNAHIIDLGSA